MGMAIGDMIYGLFKTLANTVCNFSQFETIQEIKIVQRKIMEKYFYS